MKSVTSIIFYPHIFYQLHNPGKTVCGFPRDVWARRETHKLFNECFNGIKLTTAASDIACLRGPIHKSVHLSNGVRVEQSPFEQCPSVAIF